MRNLFLLIFVFVVVLNVGCGGNDRATTVELPTATVVEAVAIEVEPTTEATTEPTEEALPTVASETEAPTVTAVPTDTVEPTEAPPATNTPEAPNADLDEEKLMASLLTIDDMPTGWTGSAAEFETRTPGGTYQFGCTELLARSIAAASVEFQKSAFGPFLSETISVYESREDAEDALADIVAAANECLEWTDDQGTTVTISPLSFPELGDETFAIRLAGSIEADSIYINIENVVIRILHGVFPAGVDSALTEEMSILAVKRFEENN